MGPLLWKDVYGNLSDVSAFQRQLWSQGKRHVASQECGGTSLVSRQTARIPGHRAGGGECPEESLQKIGFFVCLFLNLNFMHAYRLIQESNVYFRVLSHACIRSVPSLVFLTLHQLVFAFWTLDLVVLPFYQTDIYNSLQE